MLQNRDQLDLDTLDRSHGSRAMAETYKVSKGDCVDSVAFKHGLLPETVWNHPDNSDLKKKRDTPNILRAGDTIKVPEKCVAGVSCSTGQLHRFKRKGVPEILRIVLEDEHQVPRQHVSYTLTIDGSTYEGRTDGDGLVEQPIPPDARRGRLMLCADDGPEEYDLDLGYLDPITDNAGIQQRLFNLGFDSVSVNGILDAATREAIEDFQLRHDLEATGKLDDNTRRRIKIAHGS